MKLKKWEIALFIALAVTILTGTGLSKEQRTLSDKLIRLHVVANSDSEGDQALKLCVRDRILAELSEKLDGVQSRDEAAEMIKQSLPEIEATAAAEVRRQGYDYTVRAGLTQETFPTREYDTFSLPAGVYESLRVEIGAGTGRNWWCVVFPPICAETAMEDEAAMSMLTHREIALITEDGTEYVVKFKILELLGRLKGWFRAG